MKMNYSKNIKIFTNLVTRIILTGFLILPAIQCTYEEDLSGSHVYENFCHTLGFCYGSTGTNHFALIGDSWSDLMGGAKLTRTFREFLEEQHHFKVTGATMASQKMHYILEGGIHLRVIEEAGPEIQYVLLSVGGNDLIFQDPSTFNIDPEGDKKTTIDGIEQTIKEIIRTGNEYKVSLWGGEPLTWIIHGYDYLNPDSPFVSQLVELEWFCRPNLTDWGFTQEIIDTEFTYGLMDTYNERLRIISQNEPYLKYIDLRGVLGGPPVSNPSFLFDCIHPNEAGFALITEVYVYQLDNYTGGLR
jgi:hypothetical protein